MGTKWDRRKKKIWCKYCKVIIFGDKFHWLRHHKSKKHIDAEANYVDTGEPEFFDAEGLPILPEPPKPPKPPKVKKVKEPVRAPSTDTETSFSQMLLGNIDYDVESCSSRESEGMESDEEVKICYGIKDNVIFEFDIFKENPSDGYVFHPPLNKSDPYFKTPVDIPQLNEDGSIPFAYFWSLLELTLKNWNCPEDRYFDMLLESIEDLNLKTDITAYIEDSLKVCQVFPARWVYVREMFMRREAMNSSVTTTTLE